MCLPQRDRPQSLSVRLDGQISGCRYVTSRSHDIGGWGPEGYLINCPMQTNTSQSLGTWTWRRPAHRTSSVPCLQINPNISDALRCSSPRTRKSRVCGLCRAETGPRTIINVPLVVRFLLDDEYLVNTLSFCSRRAYRKGGVKILKCLFRPNAVLTSWPLNIGNSSPVN